MTSTYSSKEDRLSALPEPILIHILSFLPTKEAVQTVLIRPFGTLWTHLPFLDLDDDNFTELWPQVNEEDSGNEEDSALNHGFFEFVRNVLMLHQRPTIEKFRLCITTMFNSDIQSENMGHEDDSWFTYALRKQVKELDFGSGIVEPEEEPYKLPFQDFICDSIVKLKFMFVDMKSLRRVEMASLRVLRIEYVSLDNQVCREIIQGCPSLKELEIYNCWESMTELISENLERLKLTREVSCGDPLTISCPKLSSLDITGCVDCVKIICNSPLRDVVLHHGCYNLTQDRETAQFTSILNRVVHAKTVSLSSDCVTVLFSCMQAIESFSTDWKHIKFSIWLTNRHIPGISYLLGTSPNLEELVLDVVAWHSEYLQPIEAELAIQVPEKQQPWSSLKRVAIRGNLKNSYDALVLLVEVLLKNATVLDKLVIFTKGSIESSEDNNMSAEQLADFSAKLSSFSKTSKHVQVTLSG